jgi:hypothetical protein
VADGVPPWEDEVEGGGLGEGVGGDGSAAEDAGASLTAGLFLLSTDDLTNQNHRIQPIAPRLVPGERPGGVAVVRAPVGRYLLSLELLDAERERGWRARHGVDATPRIPGVPALSDLLLLEPSQSPTSGRTDPTGISDSLELHLERALPALLIEGDSIEVAWETYGLNLGTETVRFTLSVSSESRGSIRRALEFLRITSPDRPIELSWEEVSQGFVPSSETAFFRRVSLDLSNLPEGMARIRLAMQLPGREEVASEVIIERGAPGT